MCFVKSRPICSLLGYENDMGAVGFRGLGFRACCLGNPYSEECRLSLGPVVYGKPHLPVAFPTRNGSKAVFFQVSSTAGALAC